MTDKAPDLNRYKLVRNEPGYSDQMLRRADGAWVKYAEAATALEAAQARIAELEAEVSAWRQVRDAVAELEGLGPDWPSHGNAPLAVTSGYALHRQRAATARAEALEEAARVLDLHESVPCKPAFPDAWSDEAKDAYENGQLDAAISWQSAIRALKGVSNG